ncbi:MAG: serine hydrolase [Leptolyngbyaceae cyanobacterium SM1_1_3]|nr:serine hydrolase [Leptolyngbyaceae cyanobacterium SM1_1_3]
MTLDQLLRMSSGLQFSEIYSNPLSNVTKMLFSRGDMAAYAANRSLEEAPSVHWSYASGTTNILCRVIRQVVGGTDADYFAFPHQALFDKIGMTSAVLEPDASGTFVGSSYLYATARDWAKFGQLYLQDGVWNGERLLPKGWVDYSRTPAPRRPPAAVWRTFLAQGAPVVCLRAIASASNACGHLYGGGLSGTDFDHYSFP